MLNEPMLCRHFVQEYLEMTREELQQQVAGIRWFHRIDLGGIVTPGLDDTAAKLARVKLPADLSGQSVLDIGAWCCFSACCITCVTRCWRWKKSPA